jgi:hypothetical protein
MRARGLDQLKKRELKEKIPGLLREVRERLPLFSSRICTFSSSCFSQFERELKPYRARLERRRRQAKDKVKKGMGERDQKLLLELVQVRAL